VTIPYFFVDKSKGNIYMYIQLISFLAGFHGLNNGWDGRAVGYGLPEYPSGHASSVVVCLK